MFVNMERLLGAIRNKYFIAIVAFIVWMLFFDRHDVTTQYGYYSQLKILKAEKTVVATEIEQITNAIDNFNTSLQEQEPVARERYQMKKDHEDIFVIVEE